MPCFKPSQMYECVNTSTGTVFFRFHPPVGSKVLREFKVGCRQCSGCRSKSSRVWATRCYHESLLHDKSCFITLTVSDDFIQEVFPNGSLRYLPFQKFLRALRKKLKRKVRFIMCAEYGDQLGRPHYHAIIFGWMPDRSDLDVWKSTPVGDIYTSKFLSELWKFGNSTVANFDFACAQYVAGYCAKKINGRLADSWYKGKASEFGKMSLKPGIGEGFYKKYTSDLYRRDSVELPGGIKFSVPRYYDKLHELYHPYHFNRIRIARAIPDPKRDRENLPDRLAVRQVIHERRLQLKKRSFERGN